MPGRLKTSFLRRSNVLGVSFVAEPLDQLRAALTEVLESDSRSAHYLCPSGVHGVMEARKDPEFRRILNDASFNVADGMPIVLASRAQGFSRCERAFGPNVMWTILEESVAYGCSHFFYGGKEGVADLLAEVVQEAFPGLEVSGTFCPPFRPLTEGERAAIVQMINQSGTDVVWVGLSTPKQERWIADMREMLDVKLICSVGAAFDYHTGLLRPAPSWMQRGALEWLYRLIQEPRRLWRRYAEIVPKFLVLVTLQLARLKEYPIDE